MKKLLCVFAAFLMCLSFFGCDAKQAASSPDTSRNITASEGRTVTVNREESKESDSEQESKKSDGKNKTASHGSKNNNSSNKNNGAVNNSEKKTTAKSTEASEAGNASKPTAAKPSAETVISCTVTIECKEILNNMDDLKDGHEAFVPENGIILSKTALTVKSGQTVYDAIKKACADNNIPLNAVNSSYGIYIAGINYLDEKECGKESGWLYFVNGKSPPASCNKYKLKNGDNIVFSYTC